MVVKTHKRVNQVRYEPLFLAGRTIPSIVEIDEDGVGRVLTQLDVVELLNKWVKRSEGAAFMRKRARVLRPRADVNRPVKGRTKRR